MRNTINYYAIEALPIHKDICAYLIDSNITFHCYNGGLKMIQIERIQPLSNNNFIDEITNKFKLIEDRRGKETIYFKEKQVY